MSIMSNYLRMSNAVRTNVGLHTQSRKYCQVCRVSSHKGRNPYNNYNVPVYSSKLTKFLVLGLLLCHWPTGNASIRQ